MGVRDPGDRRGSRWYRGAAHGSSTCACIHACIGYSTCGPPAHTWSRAPVISPAVWYNPVLSVLHSASEGRLVQAYQSFSHAWLALERLRTNAAMRQRGCWSALGGGAAPSRGKPYTMGGGGTGYLFAQGRTSSDAMTSQKHTRCVQERSLLPLSPNEVGSTHCGTEV